MSTAHRRAALRAVATAPVLALAVTGLVTAEAATGAPPRPAIADSEYYVNYSEPAVQPDLGTDVEVRADGRRVVHLPTGGVVDASVLAKSAEFERKFSSGNPAAAKKLAELEAQSLATGTSPKKIKADQYAKRYKSSKTTQEAKLLTILVEFDGTEDFSDQMVPTFWGSQECMAGSVQTGPLHGGLPDPGTLPDLDNNSMWVPDFSSDYFNRLLYTSEGITERVRTDLTGPDGQPGFDISGYTMKNMYEEMSHGAYTVTGAATPWVTVPHSEAYYGAQRCFFDTGDSDEDGVVDEWVAGPYQDMQGSPENPLGPGQLPIDAVAALMEQDPEFPIQDYDVEDQYDRDGDGDVFEPDGVIDHVVLIHAGADKSGGGGEQGTYAIWAHSSAVPGGAEIPGHPGLFLSNYIVQPEDAGVGVFAHEYGHDLGLPDLYDTTGQGDSDIDFWDLMNSGSHSGPIFQSMPTHMGLWDKWVLGWVDPVVVGPGDKPLSVKVGQSSRPLKGTADGVKIDLPDKQVTLTVPHSGSLAWYSGADQDWADIAISRTVENVPDGGKFWMWNDYAIEEEWDFGFVEVSTDGGQTWVPQVVYNEDGSVATTTVDPHGNMTTWGKTNGLTGISGDWVHQYVDLSGFAGQTVSVRLVLDTDAAFQERGWFADDFSLVAGDGTVVWSDDVEGGANGWTATVGSWDGGTGPGWRIDPGSSVKAQYYMVEWRNLDGFDEGLKYAYDTTYQTDEGAWNVEKVAYNAPGMLVWYRDTTYGNANNITANVSALPSYGSKGGLLIVDSHSDPLRRSGEAAAAPFDTTVLKNLASRPQSSNNAFGLAPTYPFVECLTPDGVASTPVACTSFPAQAPVSTFSDDQGWYPGLELRGTSLYFRDIDASVAVPSAGNAPYSTRIVDPDGNLIPDLFGLDLGGGQFLGTGNPADDGVGFGTQVTLAKTLDGNRTAQISIVPPLSGAGVAPGQAKK